MPRIAIIYYSMYGHVAKMAEAVKEGAEFVTHTTADIYQVRETLPQDVLEKMHAPPKKDHPIATADVLKDADGHSVRHSDSLWLDACANQSVFRRHR
ncbi:hypothetical protein PINS_up007928 [Pythium insidiosum]|nr:hypothetical protein PINS_up007928 [Pythium insidiosum]